jgi:hypothetical protein
MAACIVGSCGKPAKNRGMCWGHYTSQRRYGDPEYSSPSKRQERRFWGAFEQGHPEDCWEWHGNTLAHKMPYGRVYYEGKQVLAHRLSYALHNGYLPDDALVLHHCDNPKCVNPRHLYLGDHTDNAQDRVQRNRSNPKRGEDAATSKLTEDQVRAIRAAFGTCDELAKEFGVSRSLISLVRTRKVWAHIQE